MSLEGTYKNVGHEGSPVVKAKFVEDGGHIVRAYSFLHGSEHAHVIVLHESERLDKSEVELGAGWEIEREDADVPKVTVLEVRRK